MISLLYFSLSLMIPNLSWDVRPVNFHLMKSTLTTWREDYHEASFEYKSTFEMIEWHVVTQSNKCCFGLYHNYELRALSQVYRENDEIFLRSMITPNDEDTAGTNLMYKILQSDDINVDWDQIRNNLRWYIAAVFIKENSTSSNQDTHHEPF